MRVPGLESPTPARAMPLGPPPEAGAGTGERTGVANGEPIRGTISLADGVAASGQVLFLIARVPECPVRRSR